MVRDQRCSDEAFVGQDVDVVVVVDAADDDTGLVVCCGCSDDGVHGDNDAAELGMLPDTGRQTRHLLEEPDQKGERSKKDYLWECLFTPKNFLADASSLSA